MKPSGVCSLCSVCFLGVFFSVFAGPCYSQDVPAVGAVPATGEVSTAEGKVMEDTVKGWNLPLPTLGGKQFWTDYRWWHGWKVQYNSTLDHWRLIDPNGIRRAWGGRQAMLDEMNRVMETTTPPAAIDEVVLLAHGLFRSNGSMTPIAEEFQRVSSHQIEEPVIRRSVVSMTYASTRDSIAEHSAAMRELLETLPGTPKISFVGHSLGNIVFRHAIGQWKANGDPHKVLDRLHRVVMLGPPNQGSAFAASLSRLGLFETLTGSTGMHLGPAWEKLQHSLGTPPCPFAIVIGDVSNSSLKNPFLDEPNDGVVTVSEATLEGASAIKTFPVVHSFLMRDESIVRATVSYLMGRELAPYP